MKKTLLIAPALTAALALAGCGKPHTEAGLEVAARVNGAEIHMRQVTDALAHNGGAISALHGAATQNALDHLIDQELLVQRALETKLEHDPDVMEAIAAERRRILGLAYLNRAVPHAPERSAEEIHKFFSDNPTLFEQRRIYETREISATVPADKSASLKMHAAHAHHFDELVLWFRAQNLPFHETTTTLPAEQIPLEMLPRLAQMSDAEISVIAAGERFLIVQLVHAQSAPLTESQAAPVIERMMGNRWRMELAMTELRHLREAAHIEYFGPFAGKHSPKEAPATTRKLEFDGTRSRDGLRKAL